MAATSISPVARPKCIWPVAHSVPTINSNESPGRKGKNTTPVFHKQNQKQQGVNPNAIVLHEHFQVLVNVQDKTQKKFNGLHKAETVVCASRKVKTPIICDNSGACKRACRLMQTGRRKGKIFCRGRCLQFILVFDAAMVCVFFS